MICPRCASDLEDGARFCGACGTRLTPEFTIHSPANAAAPSVPQTAFSAGGEVPRRQPAARPTNIAPLGFDATTLASPTSAPAPVAAPLAAPVPSPSPSPLPGGDARLVASDTVTTEAPAHSANAWSLPARTPSPVLAPGIEAAVAAAVTSGGFGRGDRKSENSGSRDDMVGRTLNKRYVVGEKVGEGGFGAVFTGKQLATGREVAIKILHPYNLTDKTIVARFRREAEACSRLRNPHTVITYDFDETEDGVLYLAMELLHGKSLHHLERAEGPLHHDRVLNILDQVAEALGEAHQNGIVHRDMKPENVFIERRGDEDYVKVLDFGIAKVLTDDRGQAALTAVGQTLGTLEFMSPEQLRGLPLDGRSDLYALGIMAYEMLTGELPFKEARTPVQIINFHMQKAAPAPSRMKPSLQIPSYVDEVILKMVAKSRDDRHADTDALRAHISRVLQGADSRADRFQTYRVVAMLGAAALLLSTLVYFLSR